MKENRIEQLTFTRFIAAIAIVIFHFGKNVYPFNHPEFSFIFEQANYSVSYFFVLSGFVMMISYGKKDRVEFFRFIKKRIARIYPLYFIALLSCLLFFITIQDFNYENTILNLFLLQSWFPGKAMTLNYPGWSLSVEMFFYLLFPFLLNVFFSKGRPTKLMLAGFIFWIFSQFLFHYFLLNYPDEKFFFYYLPVLHLNEFILGCLGGMLYNNTSPLKKNYAEVLVILVLGIIILALKFPLGFEYHNGLLGILFLNLIILIALSRNAVSKFFQQKFLVNLGKISYGIYILQLPVWLWLTDYRLNKYFNLEPEGGLTFYIRLASLIVISILSFKFIEEPLKKQISNFKIRTNLVEVYNKLRYRL